MMKDLVVAAIQSEIKWEQSDESRTYFAAHLQRLMGHVLDVVILPEMFTTGFSMNAKDVAEKMGEDMPTLRFLKQWSLQLNAVITGSVSVEQNGQYYNRLFWVRPDGTYSTYDKRHLFRMADEHQTYTGGQQLLVEEWRGWRICPLICYDLRFPVWSRNRRTTDGSHLYDVLIYVANWPAVRKAPWMKLLLTRAIENQVYTVGVNRVGTDGNGMEYTGNSAFIDPRGEYLQAFEEGKEQVLIQSFSYAQLKDFRQKFPVIDDADDFDIH
jgi:omega-amidase